MQSYGIASGMADLIASGGYGELDLSVLSRSRFADPALWVMEDLHI
jgi:hypothetical protein